ncbi:MAG: hypothetical protein RLY31_740 [Bacteroidota bacterium]
MERAAITVTNLTKKYRLGARRTGGYLTLRDTLSRPLHQWFRAPATAARQLAALQDITFSVGEGEVLGIIGRNGSGKSTLLKILSRITHPDAGEVVLRGRVSALLEVGTGFHPELTGRENIYLSGAMLGMTRRDIRARFDEIVDFSGVETFLDTPVKHFSSGMYVRLGFSVAAHLETEILLVDEVLAVGDLEFQRKCLGKMDQAARSGRTSLLVSHNLGIIKSLCPRTLLLDKGSIVRYEETEPVIRHYQQLVAASGSLQPGHWSLPADHPASRSKAYLLDMTVRRPGERQPQDSFLNSDAVTISFTVQATQRLQRFTLSMDLLRGHDPVLRSRQVDTTDRDTLDAGEQVVFECTLPAWLLNAGNYSVRPILSIHCVETLFEDPDAVVSFRVAHDPSRSAYHQVLHESNHPGAVFPSLSWTVYHNDPT